MRYVCILMGLMFCLFTYWQLNDLNQYETERWYLWVVAYAICAVVSLASYFKRLPLAVYAAIGAAALVAAIIRVQSIEWENTILYNKNNPSGNETGGLLIIVIWMGVLIATRKRLGCCCKK